MQTVRAKWYRVFRVCGRLRWTGSCPAVPVAPSLPGVQAHVRCIRSSLVDALFHHSRRSLLDTLEQQLLEKHMTCKEHEIRVKDVILSSGSTSDLPGDHGTIISPLWASNVI